ncbi:MAG: hypothetical protein IJ646_11875 [Clostridia bacterium]|nr:hypothetical protein [Clostridia bacterium]
MDPIIYLGIDNCFASKRWVRPAEWARVIRDLGLKHVEASADTECDPLYMGGAFIADWIEDTRDACAKFGLKVNNVYSGHGTYATCGLSHYDPRVTKRFLDQWMKAQVDTAAALDAGFGFFAHGFEELLLQDDALYCAKLNELYDTLADLAAYAKARGVEAGIEQMYSPHQPPWRIADAEELMREVYRRSGAPFYITADLGHMNGQQYFLKPDAALVERAILSAREGDPIRRLWLGTEAAHATYKRAVAGEISVAAAVRSVMADVETHPHLFAVPEDASNDAWVRRCGCYSPIIHLQQTDGKSSPHWTFTPENNKNGIVRPDEFLRALKASYAQPDDPAMPPKCGAITLTFEPFIATAGNTYDLLDGIAEGVRCWRRWVPRDGMRLSEIEL